MKVVYIAHPIGGDVENNVKKVLDIVAKLNISRNEIVPFAPYIVDVLSLDDSDPNDRKRGFLNNRHLFENCVEEVWLFGEKISAGMQTEIEWANELNIPIVDFMEKV